MSTAFSIKLEHKRARNTLVLAQIQGTAPRSKRHSSKRTRREKQKNRKEAERELL